MKNYLSNHLLEIFHNPLDLGILIYKSKEKNGNEKQWSISITRGPNCPNYPFKVILVSSGEEYFTKENAIKTIKEIFDSALELGESIFNNKECIISKSEYIKKNGGVLEQIYIDLLLKEIKNSSSSFTYEW